MVGRVNVSTMLEALTPLLAGPPQAEDAIGRAFGGAMRSLASFDHVVVYAYSGQGKPADLYSTFDAAAYHTFVTLYQAGSYLLDPFFHAALAGRTGLWRMRELAPDRFFSSEYFRTYYSLTGLAEEIGFFVPMPQNQTIVLSLMRRHERRVFTRVEIGLLQEAEPFVRSLVQTFWSGIAKQFRPIGPELSMHRARGADRHHVLTLSDLTRREALIVDLVLQGHSSEAIGQRLGISTGTVKVHRRNVYRKLNISSQTQLLSFYLREHRIDTPA